MKSLWSDFESLKKFGFLQKFTKVTKVVVKNSPIPKCFQISSILSMNWEDLKFYDCIFLHVRSSLILAPPWNFVKKRLSWFNSEIFTCHTVSSEYIYCFVYILFSIFLEIFGAFLGIYTVFCTIFDLFLENLSIYTGI